MNVTVKATRESGIQIPRQIGCIDHQDFGVRCDGGKKLTLETLSASFCFCLSVGEQCIHLADENHPWRTLLRNEKEGTNVSFHRAHVLVDNVAAQDTKYCAAGILRDGQCQCGLACAGDPMQEDTGPTKTEFAEMGELNGQENSDVNIFLRPAVSSNLVLSTYGIGMR